MQWWTWGEGSRGTNAPRCLIPGWLGGQSCNPPHPCTLLFKNCLCAPTQSMLPSTQSLPLMLSPQLGPMPLTPALLVPDSGQACDAPEVELPPCTPSHWNAPAFQTGILSSVCSLLNWRDTGPAGGIAGRSPIQVSLGTWKGRGPADGGMACALLSEEDTYQ